MTKTEIVAAITDYCNLTSPTAVTRVGKAVDRHYRRVTSTLGLDAARFVTRSASMSIGAQTVTFAEIEKIDRILDVTDSTAVVLLQEVSIHEIRSTQPGASAPGRWALQNTDADSVVAIFDTVPQSAHSLQADGWTTLAALSGTDEPAFPESFHDVLVWFVLGEELLKKEKDKLAATYVAKAEKLLAELRFHLADSPTKETQQASARASATTGGSGGGGNTGGSAYTQTGLVTFDRDPSAPFAVISGSAKVANLDADLLDGLSAAAFALATHAPTHESGGADPLKLDNLAAPDDTTDLNASTTAHGLAPKATAPAAGLLSVLAIGNGATARSDTALFDTTNPAALGTAAPGTQLVAARRDHVHALPKLDDLAAPDDNTDLDASASAHGLLKKLPGGTTTFLRADGTFAAPAGSVWTLLKANSGTSTNASAENVDTQAISGLTAKDMLIVFFTVDTITQATALVQAYNSTDSVGLVTIRNPIAAGAGYQGYIQVRQHQNASTNIVAGLNGTDFAGGANNNGNTATFTTAWTGAWTFAFRHGGVTAGGTFRWSYALYKVAGQ